MVIAPEDAEERFRDGEQSVIEVEVNIVDPVAGSYAAFVVQLLATEVNREIIERVAEEGQGYAVAAGDAGARAGPAGDRRLADPDRAGQHRAAHAGRRRLLRSRGPRADPPAPGGDARSRCRWSASGRAACSSCSGSRRSARRRSSPARSSRSASSGAAIAAISLALLDRRLRHPGARHLGDARRRRSACCCWRRSASASSSRWSPIRSARPSSCRC